MKLGILCVSLRELAQSFPEWHVERIFKQEDYTCIVLTNQDFDKVVVNLDSDGRIKNREHLINQRRLILNN